MRGGGGCVENGGDVYVDGGGEGGEALWKGKLPKSNGGSGE